MATRFVGGIIEVKVDGALVQAKGNFTYNLGKPKRDAVLGSDGKNHGPKTTPQIPMIEGEITDHEDLDLEAFVQIKDATVTVSLANGKIITLKDGYYAAEGNGQTEEGNIQFRFEGSECFELKP